MTDAQYRRLFAWRAAWQRVAATRYAVVRPYAQLKRIAHKLRLAEERITDHLGALARVPLPQPSRPYSDPLPPQPRALAESTSHK